MSRSGRLRIELVENPGAPAHRRWAGTVELPDGRCGRVHAAIWAEVWECVEEGVFIDSTCQAPGCAEACTEMDRCRGCGAVVCPLCNVDLAVVSPHVPESHWRGAPVSPSSALRDWADSPPLALGAKALRVALEFLPAQAEFDAVRAAIVSVATLADGVLHTPESPAARARLREAIVGLELALDGAKKDVP